MIKGILFAISMASNASKKFASAGFLYNPKTESVLLHLRDGNTTFNPNKWSLFGGLGEGDETPLEAFIREIYEEIGLVIESKNVIFLSEYLNEAIDTAKYTFFVVSDIDISALKLGEGAGFEWVKLSDLERYDLTVGTRRDLLYFINTKVNLTVV